MLYISHDDGIFFVAFYFYENQQKLSITTHTLMTAYAGFGWCKVNFLHSTLYRAMSWICARNSIDNTEMF